MMGNYEQLKAAVAAIIRDNGQEEITGDILQGVLLGIINSVGSGATFAGVATPSTNPGTPDPNVFYIAGQAGTYTNFNLTITDGLWVFENKNGTWVGTSLDVSVLFATGEDVSHTNIASSIAGAGSGDLPTLGVVQEMLNGVIGTVNRSALDTATTAGLYRVMASSAVVGYLFVTVSQSTRYRVQFLTSDITAFTDGGTESDYKGHILTRSYNDSDSTAAVCPLHTWSAWDEYGGGKFASGEKVEDVSIAQTLGNSQTSVASQKAVTDAIYNTIDIANIDGMKNDATLRTGGTLARYTVTTTLQGVTYKVGILDVMSDSAGHVLTQILTTHYTITNGVLDTSSHSDGAVRQYYRSVKINGGTLPTSDWTLWKPINDEQLDVLSAAVDAVKAYIGYYVCDTAAGTAAKVVSATGYELATGGCIRIKMDNANTADSVTLNINSTGAKALFYDGVRASSSNSWEAGEVLEVYYDGTQYQCAYSREKKTINTVNRALIPVSGNVSIIGDSISTFAGTMPSGYNTYYPNQSLGISNVYEMWWYYIMALTNSRLEINASWSGSRATKTAGNNVPDFYERASIIGNPDYIFVELGVNDSYHNVSLGQYDFESEHLSETEFIPAYTKGVQALIANYPSAKIVLLIFQMGEQYADAIKVIGLHYGLPVIDVRSYYSDNLHPNKQGMKVVARNVVSSFITEAGGGGIFATGEKVRDVGITDKLDNSHNLIESAPVNAILNDEINIGTWVIGSLGDNHEYYSMTGRIEACANIKSAIVKYTVQSGYALSIHEYSGEYTSISELVGSTWIRQSSSWLEGTGTYTPSNQTKTLVLILSKTPTSSTLAIQPSEASNLNVEYNSVLTIDNMRTMLREHDAEIDILDSAVMLNGNIDAVWYQGTLSNAHRYYSSGDVTPMRIIATIPAQIRITFTVASGYSIAIHEYSAVFSNPTQITDGSSWLSTLGTWEEGTFDYTPSSSCKTVAVIMRYGDGSTNILPIAGSNLSGTYSSTIKHSVESLQDDMSAVDVTLNGANEGGLYNPAWFQGTLTDNGHAYDSTSSYAPKRIICTVPASSLMIVTVTSGYWASVHEYSEIYANASEITGGSAWLGNTHGWFDGTQNITPLAATKTFVIVMSKGNKNVNIVPSEGSNTSVTIDTIHTEGLIEKVGYIAYDDSNSYVWGTDMIKRKCRTTLLGSLTYLQAFCKYDGKYYSTNGSNIAEQDDTFTVLRNVSINVGHGNSLQLVGNGKAWASGWDDQKMYRVDLSTLAVDSTVTLPTTGYTTAAVDEDNGLMYIFQRDTNPNYVGQYTFIVYDYVNEQTISTRKIESFAALQSVDLYEGKILMLYGLATNVAPSGMRVYNTAGDVLVSYDLQIFRTTEPEGIMFTRDTFELLVSDVNKNLYIVS